MTKCLFQGCFKKAQNLSFIEENITFTFRKTGIWPLDSIIVVNIITPTLVTPSKVVAYKLKTSIITKGIRQFQKAYYTKPTPYKINQLFKANQTLQAEASLAIYYTNCLCEALLLKKKKRQRSKKLGINGKEVYKAQFFGVKEIQEAKAFQAQKEANI